MKRIAIFILFVSAIGAKKPDVLQAIDQRKLPTAEIEKMIQAGGNVNAVNNRGETPLRLAVRLQDMDYTQLLLRYGAKVNTNHGGIIFEACGTTPEILQLLVDAHANVNVVSDEQGTYAGFTPLHLAAWFGRTEMVKILIAAKANLNAKDSRGNTAIAIAADKGFPEVVTVLRAAGAKEVNDPNRAILAVFGRSKKATLPEVEMAMRGVTNINAKNSEGETVLILAASEGDHEVIKYLIGKKADVKATAKSGMNALLSCIRFCAVETLALILDAGASVDSRDKNGETALMMALRFVNREAARLFIDRGADIRKKDKKGKTAVVQVTESELHDIAIVLIKAGADGKSAIAWFQRHRDQTAASNARRNLAEASR